MKQLLSFIFIVLFLGACSEKKVDPQQLAKEQAKRDSLALKVALMPTMDCLPFFYAQRCGIFKELNLDVRLLKYNAQMDVDTAIVNQRADVAYTDLIRAALLQSRGTGLYAIEPVESNVFLISNKSKRMRRLNHLEERMTAIARHSVTDLLLDTIIQQNKLDAAAIYHPQINDICLRCDMLCNGTIDAAFLTEPYATQAQMAGHPALYNSKKQNIQLFTFVASYPAVKDKRKLEQIKTLFKGYKMAVEALNKGGERDSITHILTSYPVDKTTADSIKLPKFRIPSDFDQKQVETAIRFLRGRKLIKNTYQGDTLVNTSFIR